MPAAYGPSRRSRICSPTFALPVAIATYAPVLAQIAFPFLQFHRVTRRFALVILLGMHLSIAVLMGLPFFPASWSPPTRCSSPAPGS